MSVFGTELKGAEKIAALEMIARHTEENYQRIGTAQGSYLSFRRMHFSGSASKATGESESVAQEPAFVGGISTEFLLEAGPADGHWDISKLVLQFEWDRPTNRSHDWYEVVESQQSLDVNERLLFRLTNREISNHWITTPEYLLEFPEGSTYGTLAGYPEVHGLPSQDGRVVFRRPVKKSEGARIHAGTVAQFFEFGGSTASESCRRMAHVLRGAEGEAQKTKADAAFRVFTNGESPPTLTLVTDYASKKGQSVLVCNGRFGFNVTLRSMTGKQRFGMPGEKRMIEMEVKQEATVTYKLESGVYFPEKLNRNRYQGAPEARLVDSESFQLFGLVLGEELPADRFTTDAFHLRHGDRLVDEIAGKLLVYHRQDGLVPVEDFEFGPIEAPIK